jgi:hypothetical protein
MKIAKAILKYTGEVIKESIAQIFTILGFFIAWLTMTGTAQQLTGLATIAAIIIWLATIPLRKED